jgi:hypothetical protein|tara:strand:- start:286 stop:570 length:285 start_codon:yes stop_codon:yes gene_type:complete
MIEETKYPSLWKMVASFTLSLIEYVKGGQPVTTPVEYAKRLKICNACPHLKRENFRCGKCGCLLEFKARWATSSCPDDPKRWDTAIQAKEKNEG